MAVTGMAVARWHPRRIPRSGRVLLFLGLLVPLMVRAVIRASREVVSGDFHVFWLAGKAFRTGAPLYFVPHGAIAFNYPPFAAMLFIPFSFLPVRVAAALFNCLNVVLIAVSIWLTYAIFETLYPERNRALWPLVLAVVLSGHFALYNINLIQMNEVMFVLCLLGVKGYLDRKDLLAASAFVVGTLLKIIPGFFLAWLVIRGRSRAAMMALTILLLCLLLPILARGPGTGLQDLSDYRSHFLAAYVHGRVMPDGPSNQNLGSLIYRMVLPSENQENIDYQIFALTERSAAVIYRVSFFVALASFLAHLVALRIKGKPLSVFEIGSVFLIGHLLSGITWKAHLVTLLFVFYAFLSTRIESLPRGLKVLVVGVNIMSLVIGLSGRDLVGWAANYYAAGYSLYAWTLVFLYLGCLIFSQRSAPIQRAQGSDAKNLVPSTVT